MPSSLKYKKKDPNRKGRGPGYYYHRGHGYWSKYSKARDAKRKSRGNDPRHIGTGKWRHTHDIIFRLAKRIKRKIIRHRKQRKITGYTGPYWLKKARRSGPRLEGPFAEFFKRLKEVWKPIYAWVFSLKLQREAKRAKKQGKDTSNIGFYELWESIGEHIDTSLRPGEAFRALYDRIKTVFGSMTEIVYTPIEELQQWIHHLEDQLEYAPEEWRKEIEKELAKARRELALRTRGVRKRR